MPRKVTTETPVSSIAKEAGVSKGLMYNYFTGKEDLLLQLVNGMFDEVDCFFPSMKMSSLQINDLKTGSASAWMWW
ncbi:MAG: TetR/AcrR family transcriptional regulator [Bacteroidia bacterium]